MGQVNLKIELEFKNEVVETREYAIEIENVLIKYYEKHPEDIIKRIKVEWNEVIESEAT